MSSLCSSDWQWLQHSVAVLFARPPSCQMSDSRPGKSDSHHVWLFCESRAAYLAHGCIQKVRESARCCGTTGVLAWRVLRVCPAAVQDRCGLCYEVPQDRFCHSLYCHTAASPATSQGCCRSCVVLWCHSCKAAPFLKLWARVLFPGAGTRVERAFFSGHTVC